MNRHPLRHCLWLRCALLLACWPALIGLSLAQPRAPASAPASAPKAAAAAASATPAAPAVPAKPAAPASTPSGKPVVSLLYPAPHIVPAGKIHADLGLPLSVAEDYRASELCVERAGILYRNQPDRELTQRIQVAKNVVHEAASAPELRIQFTDISLLPVGDYQVDMLIVRCAEPEQALQRLPVVVTRPGAKLEAPGKQVVDRWLATPWGVPLRTEPEFITLRPQEDASASRITKLAVSSSTFGTPGGVNVGLMKARTEAAEAGAGVVLRWMPVDFPLGTATGNVTLSGTDLAAALRFDVEVRTRLQRCWIAILVALGVVVGWWVRVRLQPRAELAQSRETALRQLAQWERELAAIADAEFARVRDAELEKLEVAIGKNDKAALDQAQREAKTAIETARTELNGRLKTARDGIEALRKAWDVQARLPARIREVAANALARVGRCQDLVDKKNAAQAVEHLRRAGLEIDQQLRDALAQLAVDHQDMIGAAQGVRPLFSAATAAELDTRLVALQASAKEALKPPTTSDGLAPPLGALAQLGREWRALLHSLGTWLGDDAKSLTSEITQRVPKAQQAKAIEPWLAALTQAIEALQSDGGEETWVSPAWKLACRDAVDAAAQLVKSLPSFNPKLDKAAREAFDAELKSGHLLQACQALPTLDSVLKVEHPSAAAAAAAGDVGQEWVHLRASTAAPAAEGTPFDLPNIEQAADAQHRDWLVTTTMLTLLSGVLLTWASVAAFEDKFIGTLGELLGLFLWGFSADLGLDKVAEKLRAAGIVPKT